MSKPRTSIYKRILSRYSQLSPFIKIISAILGILVAIATIFSCVVTSAAALHLGPFALKTVSEVPPIGKLLYSAKTPGPLCDTGGGVWTDYRANITCKGDQTKISNTLRGPQLAGIFLKGIPGIPEFPSDYVIEVKLLQDSLTNADFGIYFRNQPGQQLGVYTFLIHPDSSWSAYVYDNDPNGTIHQIQSGHFGAPHASVMVDVSVIGSSFTFYENGHEVDQGNITESTYPTGTVGIAVDQGGTIFASNFAIYTPNE